MTTENFYRDLPGFLSMKEMTNPNHFFNAPEDWIVVLTDIKDSTTALKAGRYKEVNVVGASCIIAAKNACEGLEFPYVFGGDGATLLVPLSHKEAVGKALSHTRLVSMDQFGVELRVALIPVSHIYAMKKEIKIAKFVPTVGNAIAMLSGGGITYAEELAKKIIPDKEWLCDFTPQGSFKGLECRWNPVHAAKDGVLTVIVQPRDQQSTQSPALKDILDKISTIALASQPVTLANLKEDSRPKDLMVEARMKHKNKFMQSFYLFRIHMLLSLFLKVIRAQKTKPESGVYKYLHQLTMNTDYIKFDDSLRMVLDIYNEQKDIILGLLKEHYEKQEIFYGTYWSDSTLMTCFIETQEKHMHFVDGSAGGYTMAASLLKEQKKNQIKKAV